MGGLIVGFDSKGIYGAARKETEAGSSSEPAPLSHHRVYAMAINGAKREAQLGRLACSAGSGGLISIRGALPPNTRYTDPTAATTSVACSRLRIGLIGIARCRAAASSVPGSSTPAPQRAIGGWRWTGVR